ncbi:hypothetical protein ACVCNR_09225 [Aquamicrobium terrae]
MAIAPDKDELPEAINPGATHGEAIGSFAGKPLYHASLNADECRALLAGNGFTVLRHGKNAPACGGATVWLAKREA